MDQDSEELRKAEKRRIVGKPDVPDDVKSELNEEIEQREESDDELGRGDGPG